MSHRPLNISLGLMITKINFDMHSPRLESDFIVGTKSKSIELYGDVGFYWLISMLDVIITINVFSLILISLLLKFNYHDSGFMK